MTLKPSSPWTAGRAAANAPSPNVRCEGGKCTWSTSGDARGGEGPLKRWDSLSSKKALTRARWSALALKGTAPAIKK